MSLAKKLLVAGLLLALLGSGCTPQATQPSSATTENQPPAEIPRAILVKQIPASADIMFTSICYVLNDTACLDSKYQLKANFITDPGCNRKIYSTDGGLAAPRQIFTMDRDGGHVTRITNNDCFFITTQVVNSTTVMALAACNDTDGNGLVNEKDKTGLYLIDLPTGTMTSLTNGYDLSAINNPDYSPIQQKIVFSAQPHGVFHNYLFTIDLDKQLEQITDDASYMDFDCAWSEDGSQIVFNRLPAPFFSKPSQIWLMDSDGTGLKKITDGGPDTNGEKNFGSYPIGTDADPDLSPDNSRIVFSRLKTGRENAPIGVWELDIIDIASGKTTVLDDQYANMIPEWKSGGIIFTRQQSTANYTANPMQVKQSLYRYTDGQMTELEKYPYNVFPIGAFGGSWITTGRDVP